MSRPDEPAATVGDLSPARSPKRFFGSLLASTILATLGVVLVGAALVPWVLSDPANVSRLVAAAMPGLRADVTVGRASIGWTGPIVIEHLTVSPHDDVRPPLSIRRIEGSHGLAWMLLSGGDLGRFTVEGLEADIVCDADRNSNLSSLIAAPPPAATRGPREARRSPVRLRIAIQDARVRIAGPWSPQAWESDPIDILAKLGPSADGPWSEWTVDRVQLLEEAKLEANVAQGVLAYIAPVLADAARTSGRFSLRLDGATFPVGVPEKAALAGMLQMHEVNLGPGPLVSNVLQSLPGRLQPPSSIRIADDSKVEFHLAERRVWHKGLEFGVPLAKPGQRLDVNSSGSVGLDDKSIDLKLALPIPADLPADRPLLAALAGKSISIGIGGHLGQPRVNFDGSIRATAGEVAADLIDRLRGSDRPRPPEATAPPVPRWVPPQPRRPVADTMDSVDAPDGDVAPQAGAASRPAPAAATRTEGEVPERLESLREKRPGDVTADPTAEAIIDLVGGVLDEVAKRRAERAAAGEKGDGPPPRRGRLLRRLAPRPVPPADQP